MWRNVLVVTLILTLSTGQISFGQDEELKAAFANSYRYEKQQNYADAIKSITTYSKTLSGDDEYTVNLRLGWLYHLSGNYANARQYYSKAITMKPSAVEPRNGYLLPLLAQQRYDEVEQVARQILTIDSKNYYANLRLTYALRLQGKFTQAEQINNLMLGLYPTDVSYMAEQGYVYLNLGKLQEAKTLFNRILMLDPENVSAKEGLALLAAPKVGEYIPDSRYLDYSPQHNLPGYAQNKHGYKTYAIESSFDRIVRSPFALVH